jgi:hypothetical protein
MKLDRLVVALKPMRVLFSPPRSGTTPRRLRISLWQTESWRIRVINLREGPPTEKETRRLRHRVKLSHENQQTKARD